MNKLTITKGQRILISGILVAISFVLNKALGYEPVTIIFMIASTLVAGTPIFMKAVGALVPNSRY